MNIPNCKDLKKAIDIQESITLQLKLEKLIIDTMLQVISGGGRPVLFKYCSGGYEEQNLENIKKSFTDNGFIIDTLKEDTSSGPFSRGFIVKL